MTLDSSESGSNPTEDKTSWSFRSLFRRGIVKAKSVFGFAPEPNRIGSSIKPESAVESEPTPASLTDVIEPPASRDTADRRTTLQGQPAAIPLSPAVLASGLSTQPPSDSFDEPSQRGADEKAGGKFGPAQDNGGVSLAEGAEYPGGAETIVPEQRIPDQPKPRFISFEQVKRNSAKIRSEVKLADATPFNDLLRQINQNCNAVAADFALSELRRKLSFHIEFDTTSWDNVDPDLLISINSELGQPNGAPDADLGEILALLQQCGLVAKQAP